MLSLTSIQTCPLAVMRRTEPVVAGTAGAATGAVGAVVVAVAADGAGLLAETVDAEATTTGEVAIGTGADTTSAGTSTGGVAIIVSTISGFFTSCFFAISGKKMRTTAANKSTKAPIIIGIEIGTRKRLGFGSLAALKV